MRHSGSAPGAPVNGFPFCGQGKIVMKTLIANNVYRPTAKDLINMLEQLRVVILQDAAEMLIAERTYYLFLCPVFSCEQFKESVIVTMIALGTVVEEKNISDVFGEALYNNINNFYHTLDAGLKKMTSNIN
jgi:hypothetical protein